MPFGTFGGGTSAVTQNPLEIGSGGAKILSNSGVIEGKNNANDAFVRMRCANPAADGDVDTQGARNTAIDAIMGVPATAFQIDDDNSGPKLKNSSGALLVRNAADDALVTVAVATATDATHAATKAQLDTKKTTPASFTSSNIAVSQAGSGTLAHGLSGMPTRIWAFLECLTNEHGFVDGQLVPVSPSCTMYAATARGVIWSCDATNIYYRFANNSSVFTALGLSSGDVVTLTNANWELIIKAERDV